MLGDAHDRFARYLRVGWIAVDRAEAAFESAEQDSEDSANLLTT
jgi:hypothetical protein